MLSSDGLKCLKIPYAYINRCMATLVSLKLCLASARLKINLRSYHVEVEVQNQSSRAIHETDFSFKQLSPFEKSEC